MQHVPAKKSKHDSHRTWRIPSRMCPIGEGHRRVPCCAVRWLPALIILGFLVWSYHVFVYQICIKKVSDYLTIGLLLFFYHLLLFMFLWTWFRCIFVAPVRIPDQWKISPEDVDKLKRNDGIEGASRVLNYAARNLPIATCTIDGLVRYCKTCWIIKPDRAHHCRTCHMCVLKMDHHCPWIVNCVHFHNFKYFILFLFYAEVYCFYLFCVMVYDLYLICGFEVTALKNQHSWNILQYLVCILFNIFTVIMYTVSLLNVSRNRTTMESAYATYFLLGGKNNNGFNLGYFVNFRDLYGDKWYLWPFPIFSSRGDGFSFPLAHDRLKEVRTGNQKKDNQPTRTQMYKENMNRILGIHQPPFNEE
uniref:Palmitoyltransferase n=2 Tax=Drosophila melanogaster TaxID=7227 RepID=Q4V6X7_DROME|nr:IP01239p [Drosophila melanogaster]